MIYAMVSQWSYLREQSWLVYCYVTNCSRKEIHLHVDSVLCPTLRDDQLTTFDVIVWSVYRRFWSHLNGKRRDGNFVVNRDDIKKMRNKKWPQLTLFRISYDCEWHRVSDCDVAAILTTIDRFRVDWWLKLGSQG